MEIDLSVNIGKLKLCNPIVLASGTVGYGEEVANFLDLSKIGAIITKSISLKPRRGNSPQRIVETSSGMLNAIGLANVGLDEFVKTKIPILEKLNSNVICNIAASSIEEYVECTKALNEFEIIKAFEINVSCPNVKEGGLIFGNDLTAVGKITSEIRVATNKTIIIKLSPNNSNIAEFAKVVKQEGGDAVSAINTLIGTAFDIYTKKPILKNITGGLSGPAIKPVALAKVLEISRSVDIPIIGLGGIMNWKDVVEFMIVGASAVQIGTVNFINPFAAYEIIDGLIKYCKNNSIINISQLTGTYQI
ncbi:MAG: dihydroorotate dehydrogenase [Ignavibacteriales bacterium]|nr:dihydroorotate dehydrogenase [Ignavibacteriales bacterium]